MKNESFNGVKHLILTESESTTQQILQLERFPINDILSFQQILPHSTSCVLWMRVISGISESEAYAMLTFPPHVPVKS